MISIALFQPEIPQNTGNIARLSVALGVELILIGPLGYRLDDRTVRRAGLDYWKDVRLKTFDDSESFFHAHVDRRLVGVDPRGTTAYHQFEYQESDILCFGRESVGLDFLPPESVYIPMAEFCRSINLSNAVAIVAFEAMKGRINDRPQHARAWGGTITD